MNISELSATIKQQQNYLCIGLDTDIARLPAHLPRNASGVLAFNKAIIDATAGFCVSYKINTAFYEAMGIEGWEVLQQTVQYIPSSHFTIADAKRGDIGNTSAQYAKTFFEVYGFDAVTVAPYMGEDSLRPFLEYNDKCTIVLGLTSNAGSANFQQLMVEGGDRLYLNVMKQVAQWASPGNLMFVVGATRADQLGQIRHQFPNHFFLVPGVGAQGGSLEEVSHAALIAGGGILVNVSRAVIYASSGQNFADEAGAAAQLYAGEMRQLYSRYIKL